MKTRDQKNEAAIWDKGHRVNWEGVGVLIIIDILIIIINFPYSTCIRSFFGSSILTSLFILKCFFGLVSVIFLQYIANVTHRTFEIVQKNRDPANIKII